MAKQKMVMVKALKMGTVTLASGSYHFDPNGTEQAQRRPVPEDVALRAKDKGYVELTGEEVLDTDASVQGKRVGEAMGEQLVDSLGGEGEDQGKAAIVVSANTTAFPKGGRRAIAAGLADEPDEDEDAPTDGLETPGQRRKRTGSGKAEKPADAPAE